MTSERRRARSPERRRAGNPESRRRGTPAVALAVVSALLGTGCAGPDPLPPAPAPPGVATFVSASFDLTWNAALDYFSATSTPLATRDRTAGTIETERVAVDPSLAAEYADCGALPDGDDEGVYPATSAVYTVTVRDDGYSSWVQATAAWEAPDAPFACQSTGVWEGETQEAIKLAAEVNR